MMTRTPKPNVKGDSGECCTRDTIQNIKHPTQLTIIDLCWKIRMGATGHLIPDWVLVGGVFCHHVMFLLIQLVIIDGSILTCIQTFIYYEGNILYCVLTVHIRRMKKHDIINKTGNSSKKKV